MSDCFDLDQIINGDSIEVLKMTTQSVPIILSDIPYGIGAEDWDILRDNANSAYMGSSPAQGRNQCG